MGEARRAQGRGDHPQVAVLPPLLFADEAYRRYRAATPRWI